MLTQHTSVKREHATQYAIDAKTVKCVYNPPLMKQLHTSCDPDPGKADPNRGKIDLDPGKILIVLPTWLGDFVMATPALRAIRDRFANAHITFLMEPNLRELVHGGDWMNECVEWPPKSARSLMHKPYRDLVWDLRRRRFDWAIMLPNSFRSALMARMTGAKQRIGYDRDGRGFLLTDRLPVTNRRTNHADWPVACPVKPGKYVPVPMVDYYADLVEAIGCERPGDQLELFTSKNCDESLDKRLTAEDIAQHRPLVVISPGAKFGASKCWFPERFAAVADRLIEKENAAVIITCGPGEESIAWAIGQAMKQKQKGLIFDKPLLSLGELKSLIQRCDLLICNDAGPRHFAKAFRVPVVTVFGPTHTQWTETNYDKETIVNIDVDCGPCQQKLCPLTQPQEHLQCLTGVTVDMVFEAAVTLLQTQSAKT